VQLHTSILEYVNRDARAHSREERSSRLCGYIRFPRYSFLPIYAVSLHLAPSRFVPFDRSPAVSSLCARTRARVRARGCTGVRVYARKIQYRWDYVGARRFGDVNVRDP